MECTVCNLICCYRNIQRGLKSEGLACIMGGIIVGHATGEEVAAINKAGVLFFFILMVDGAYCNLLNGAFLHQAYYMVYTYSSPTHLSHVSRGT